MERHEYTAVASFPSSFAISRSVSPAAWSSIRAISFFIAGQKSPVFLVHRMILHSRHSRLRTRGPGRKIRDQISMRWAVFLCYLTSYFRFKVIGQGLISEPDSLAGCPSDHSQGLFRPKGLASRHPALSRTCDQRSFIVRSLMRSRSSWSERMQPSPGKLLRSPLRLFSGPVCHSAGVSLLKRSAAPLSEQTHALEKFVIIWYKLL